MQSLAVLLQRGGPGDLPGQRYRRNLRVPALPHPAIRHELHLVSLGTRGGCRQGSGMRALLSVSRRFLQSALGPTHLETPLQTRLQDKHLMFSVVIQ